MVVTMKKGEVYQGIVEKMNFPNKGIVRIEDTTVPVKNALPGQTVSFRITKKRNGQAEGRLLEVVEPAACEKQCAGDSICLHAGECGGCLYQGFPYEEQLKIKEEQVLRLLEPYLAPLKRVEDNGAEMQNEGTQDGVMPDGVMPDGHARKEVTQKGNYVLYDGIKASPRQYGYRNKMEFTFGDEVKDGPLSLGLHKRGSFYDILTMPDCRIIDEDYRKILMFTRDYFAERKVPYFHRMNHTGYLRHLLVRKAAKTGEVLVALVTTTQPVPNPGLNMEQCLLEWKEGVLSLFGSEADRVKGILHIENDSLADVVKCDRQIILHGTDEIREELLGLTFSISTFSFFQTNSLGAEVLYGTVRDYVKGEEAGGVVYDLYSGTGTIAQMLAPAAKQVIGVEIVEDAVEAAKRNAKLNGLTNCEFLAGDVLKVLDEIAEKPDYIILDPPRDGVHPKALSKIIRYGVPNMVYISCKPISLARDLEMLTEAGYAVKRLGMVDMFPWTGNVETVVLLSQLRQKPDDYIDVDVDVAELEGTSAETKATYEKIKMYVAEHNNGMKVSSLYIAQVKRKCGIELAKNFNLPKSEDAKQPQCPIEKEDAIVEALKAFKMI